MATIRIQNVYFRMYFNMFRILLNDYHSAYKALFYYNHYDDYLINKQYEIIAQGRRFSKN